ncbi:helix-turn-helix domain-containing protein [Lysinibacillus louembei]|uniref:Helix-turn-helix domain-containing protein n=1 Tax=Lysinibacillus louembei TaxID=1470088 RepID=A0ABZ0RXB5_9BACI|nr:helix-turn-helix domain-containing protein [Lysinibacillus louembei]WPK12795.1 helix-turn-helix domain-containing protein [Lysinibacillus louembei]
MRILLIDRDIEEARGISWYIKNYFPSHVEVEYVQDTAQLQISMETLQPHVIIVEIEMVTPSIEKLLQRYQPHIVALTAQPIFQHAAKAIQLQAAQLFVKPIPLEQLKTTLLALNIDRARPIATTAATDVQLYVDLYLKKPTIIDIKEKHFFIIEPSHFESNLQLYQWFIELRLFQQMTALPLQNRIICVVENVGRDELLKQLRLLIQEWHVVSSQYMNIALYDGDNATIREMYDEVKKVLIQRFYKGYEHIFLSSEQFSIVRLDPLLTPEEQQLWINSLEERDTGAIKAFLYQLAKADTFYHHDDVRIHLTSVLAQLRRYMMKYHLQQQASIEADYRKLFHLILEGPILYSILQEMMLFTQMLIDAVEKSKEQLKADYSELAIELIQREFSDSTLNLHSVAQQLGISPNYLSTLFSKKQGIPFKRYVQNVRIQAASKALLETDLAITEIAQLNGFEDVNYFIKVFKQHLGTTPYRYRANNPIVQN